MRIVFFLLFFLSLTNHQYAQEAVGLDFGSNNGITSSTINPAFIIDYEYSWELQLAGASVFAETNYSFINQASLINVIRNRNEIEILESDTPMDQFEYPLVFRSMPNEFELKAKAEIYGPGFLFKTKNHSIGVSSKLRAYASGTNLSNIFGYHNFINLPVDSIVAAGAFDANGASWAEYAVHYAYKMSDGNIYGASLKYLKGYQAASIRSNSDINFSQNNQRIISSSDFGQAGYSYTDWENINNSNGSGIALDLGLSSTQFFSSDTKIGVSLLDLGWVNFSGQDYDISYDNPSIGFDDYNPITNDTQLINQINEDFATIDSSSNFRVYLPTALSLQLSTSINEHLNIDASITQNIKLSTNQISRPNSMNASLSYNRKHFSAHLPLSIYNYENIRLGAAMRFMFLTIGSDHLTSVFSNNQNFDGSDIYINFKIYPFWNRRVDAKGRDRDVQCYDPRS